MVMTNAERQKRWRERHPLEVKKLKEKWLEKKGLTWAAYKRYWRMRHPEESQKRIHTLTYYVKLAGIDVDNLKEKYPELQKLLNTPYKELKRENNPSYYFPSYSTYLVLKPLRSSWIKPSRILYCLYILNDKLSEITGVSEKETEEAIKELEKDFAKNKSKKHDPMIKAMEEGKFFSTNTAKIKSNKILIKPNTRNLMRVRLSDPISNHKGEKICPFCNTSFRTWRRFDAHLLWHKIGKEDNIGFWQDGGVIHFLKLKKHKKDLTTPKEIINNLENEYNKNLSDLKNSIDSFLN